jgi:hypothetical protein
LAPERHSTWKSLLIGCEDKAGGAVLADRAAKRRTFLEKFMSEWKVGGSLWKAVQNSLKIITVNHFKHYLSSFHLNDRCIIWKSVTDNVSFCFVLFFRTSFVGKIVRIDRHLATSARHIGAERKVGVRANCLL